MPALAARERPALEPTWSALVERHMLRAENGGSWMNARKTPGVEFPDLPLRPRRAHGGEIRGIASE